MVNLAGDSGLLLIHRNMTSANVQWHLPIHPTPRHSTTWNLSVFHGLPREIFWVRQCENLVSLGDQMLLVPPWNVTFSFTSTVFSGNDFAIYVRTADAELMTIDVIARRNKEFVRFMRLAESVGKATCVE